jgi:ferredoxin-NADP reductase
MTAAPPGQVVLDVRVHAISVEADGIFSFELRSCDGAALPAFTAGAHVNVMMPGGIERSYSLIGAPHEEHRYVIAVARDPASRGGSAFMCDTLRPGDRITVSHPTNTFPLVETGAHSVLIAGGIGITPIWSMVRRLEHLQRSWLLFYAARTQAKAALLGDIRELMRAYPDRVVVTFDQEPGQTMLDIAGIVSAQPAPTHFYCCGPSGMLGAFEAATADRDRAFVHIERFAADEAPARGGFEVVLAKTGKTIFVPAHQTILEALLAAGLITPRSCMQGVCGTCETFVLEGVPDHRDAVLSKRERASNTKMMICCSGCVGERLVLDL